MIKQEFWLIIGFSLLMGIAAAADYDYLALKGSEQERKTRINAFVPNKPPPASIEEKNCGYLQWKNNCAPTPMPVGGCPLAFPNTTGFCLVQPYVVKPVRSENSFFAALGDMLRP